MGAARGARRVPRWREKLDIAYLIMNNSRVVIYHITVQIPIYRRSQCTPP